MAHDRKHPKDGKSGPLSSLMPSSLIESTVLIRGGAFRQWHQFPTDAKKKERYFFVVNFDPKTDEVLLLYTATTQIADREAHRRSEVLVKVSPKEYHELGANSVIDCESLIKRDRKELIKQISNKEVTPLDALPDTVIARICEAVKATRILSQKEKEKIIGPVEQASDDPQAPGSSISPSEPKE